MTAYSYDALKRLIGRTADLGGVNALTQYGYDAADRLTTVIAPNNATTTYRYDDLGNLLEETSPDRGTTAFTHDAAGNVTAKTDALGQHFTYTYDAANRLTRLTAPVPADTLIYTYDSCDYGAGRLCAVRAGDESVADPVLVTYAYNAFGQVTAHQGVGYAYDAAGRLATLTYPSGAQLTYSYDAAGQVSGISLTRGGQTTPLASSITHAPFGPVTGLAYGNGLAFSRTLDTAYRPTAQSVPGALSLTGLQYDGAGNLTVRTDGASSESYGYDALNRLTSASGAFGSRGYAYDANGNRTLLTVDAGSVDYTYAPTSNRLTEIDATPVTLDPTGNTLALRGGTLLYTTHNRLMRAYDATSDTAYRYNGLGQRIEKVREGTTITRYVYGLDGALLAETDAAGTVQVEYVYLEGAPLAVLYATGAVPLAYVHPDPLGTPRALTNTSGVVVWRASYDPFGMATVDADPDGDGQTVVFNLRLPGQYYDAETGLHYNYYRTYDPSLGRYLESDPIGLGGGLNTYAYVGSNPLGLTDRFGLATDALNLPRPLIPEWVRPAVGGWLSLITATLSLSGDTAKEESSQCCTEGYQNIYRVVGPNEYKNISTLNAYQINPLGFTEKQFWLTTSDAYWFANAELIMDPSKAIKTRYLVTSRVCKSTLAQGTFLSDVGHPFVSFDGIGILQVNADARATGGIQTIDIFPPQAR